MPTLPIAPRPLAGEGFSSWVARLAVHNFVEPAGFWAWLGCEDIEDLAPGDGLLGHLEAITQLPAGALRAHFFERGSRAHDPLTMNRSIAVRGSACRACCREANENGGDHVVSAASASLWRISCPRHRVRLMSLDGYRLVLGGDRARFHAEVADTVVGGAGRVNPPAGLTLAFEDAAGAAVDGRPPGSDWAPRTAASFRALIEVVLWRRDKEVSFAHEFDPLSIRGGATISLGPINRRQGLILLEDLGPRERMNVFAAIATLLARPSARDHPLAVQMGWNRPGGPDPFDYVASQFPSAQRALIAERLPRWPDCIATPMSRALARA